MFLFAELRDCQTVHEQSQVILEEFLMKDVDLPAVEIIGYEGFWVPTLARIFPFARETTR